jgi:hypothetical protein
LGLVRRVDRRRAFGGELVGRVEVRGAYRVGVGSCTFLSFMCVCVCIYAGVHVYVYVYIRVCMCVWVSVCMCTCSYGYYLVGPYVDVFICILTTS